VQSIVSSQLILPGGSGAQGAEEGELTPLNRGASAHSFRGSKAKAWVARKNVLEAAVFRRTGNLFQNRPGVHGEYLILERNPGQA